jgi:pilus assembly protein CpaE
MTPRGIVRDPSLSALLIAADRDLAHALETALQPTRCFEVLSDLKEYPTEQTLEIRLRQLQPDVVLLDVSSDFSQAERVMRFLAGHQPVVRTVGVSSRNDPGLLVAALRAGAADFLFEPFSESAQKEAAAQLKRLREPETVAGQQDFGRVIAFSSAKPGSGATTLAIQSAYALRRATGKRVLLADLDLLNGSAAFSLRLNPTYSILDALERSDQLDPALWSSLVVGSGGVDVLAAPDEPYHGVFEMSRLHEVIEYARMLYSWVILDLPAIFRQLSMFALSEAEQSYLVATPELASLHLGRRAVAMLQQLGFDRDRFRILVNRTNRRDGISTADMEKIFSSPVFATVPNDFFALHKAVTRAEPLSTDTEISRSFDHLAHRIAGINGKDRKSGAAVVEAKAVLSEG